MSVMKIVLLGSNGQVGRELQRSLAPLGELHCLARADADMEKPEALRLLLRDLQADVVVNASGYTAVDKAESEPEKAMQINAASVGVLAEECQALGAWLVHYSTDYVFDGRKQGAYNESDQPAPLSVYGLSKWQGEQQAQRCQRHLIVRTSWVYAAHGTNFVRTILRLAQQRTALQVVADQYGAPTGAELIADITACLLQRLTGADAIEPGIYHLAATGETTWFDLACHIVQRARAAGLPVLVPEEGIQAISTADYPCAARRPMNSRLSVAKLETVSGLSMPHWQAGIDAVLNELLDSALSALEREKA